MFYSWITYIVPIFRYGSLVYLTSLDLRNGWDRWGTTIKMFLGRYNYTVKLMLKLPFRTAFHIVDNILGPFGAK